MNEDEEVSDDDFLKDQDIRLADAIIGGTELEDRAYGSDVELEEDLTERPVGRRGRRKKVEKIEREEVVECDVEEEEFEEDFEDSGDDAGAFTDSDEDAEYAKPKVSSTTVRSTRARASRAKVGAKVGTTAVKESKVKMEGLKMSKETILTPRKRTASSLSPSPSPSPKRKVGRPSKAHELIGKIKSIFHADDEEFFSDNKSPEKPAYIKRTGKIGNDDDDDKDDFSLFSQTLGSLSTDVNTTAPIVSGIVKPIEEDSLQINRKKFEPMPIPKVNADGSIQDKDFITKYLKNMEKTTNFRLTDDGAIFLEGTEGYFEQHSVRSRATGNSLSQFAPPLEYSEFIPYVKLGLLFKFREKEELHKLHSLMYHQWCFEMSQGFNLNFNGTGLKRTLILDFIENYFFDWFEGCYGTRELPEVLVVNGYNPAVKLKQIVGDIVSVFIPREKKKKDNIKFPKHVLETVPFLVNYIDSKRRKDGGLVLPKVVLAIHSIDGPGLRDEKTQSLLSLLCSIPEIWLISSSDNINVSLLWDLHKLKNFNFIFHDLTSYELFSTEVSFKDILSMGRSTKNTGNKGAKYVLSSLTKNAKNLFRLLLSRQLEIMKEQHSGSQASRNILKGTIKYGLEFKIFYQACLEEFITSNEISFRTLLGEFMEHKMCNLVKDDSGTEIVFIPFSYSEMEKLQQEF